MHTVGGILHHRAGDDRLAGSVRQALRAGVLLQVDALVVGGRGVVGRGCLHVAAAARGIVAVLLLTEGGAAAAVGAEGGHAGGRAAGLGLLGAAPDPEDVDEDDDDYDKDD